MRKNKTTCYPRAGRGSGQASGLSLGLSLAGLGLGLALSAFSCEGGRSANSTADANKGGTRAKLVSVEYGRIVDVYAYRRADPANADRLLASNRRPVLVERDVIVGPQVQNEDPFASNAARYRFLPYDARVGHSELLILFDDQLESTAFERAFSEARAGLVSVNPHFAFTPGVKTTPPPIVPRDAALRLTFDPAIGLDTSFFRATPTAVQILQLVGDPDVLSPAQAYEPVISRVVSKQNGKYLLVDPDVTGDEAKGTNPNTVGFPASLNGQTANIRIALPTGGVLAKTLRIDQDAVPSFNSVGVRGEPAVIRDFRAGNKQDARFGGLPAVSSPELVARKDVGILSIDAKNRVLHVNKRFADVVIRGRLPFVDGMVSKKDGRPLGPRNVPQKFALQSGDMIIQEVESASGEKVRVRAEVVRNLAIPVGAEDPGVGTGGGDPTAFVEVATLQAFDSRGNVVSFEASTLPLGADATLLVHYHDQIKVASGTQDVGDKGRRQEFLLFDPAPPKLDPVTGLPLPPNANIDPNAGVTVRFSKPMMLDTLSAEDNLVVANVLGEQPGFVQNIKVGGVAVVPALLADQTNDATSFRLSTPLGLFHKKGTAERYFVHLFDGEDGPRDRAGTMLELHDTSDIAALTFAFTLAQNADANYVGAILRRMNAIDEDGTKETGFSADHFGQFQLRDGKLFGFPTVRFSKVADNQTLPTILRGQQGECTGSVNGPFPLYQTPMMIVNLPPLVGGISEPHITQGSRLQMTYREDDFHLGYRAEDGNFEIDVEQLHWAPFAGRTPLLTFDKYDRYSLVLGTAEKRPDMRPVKRTSGTPPVTRCVNDGASFRSGLGSSFEGNYLDHSVRVQVVKDKVYTINPNNAFLSSTLNTFIGYPKFEKSYTWRDRRYVGWDSAKGVAIGLGGSQNPNDQNRPDRTRDVTSPFLPEIKPDVDGVNVTQPDDFKGDKVQDHHPYALPLLVDFFVFPDDPANGLAKSDNLFQIAYIGPIWPTPIPPHGFYNSLLPPGSGWPVLRVHSTGGIDPQNNEILVDPINTQTATGGWLSNQVPGFAKFQSPFGDDHLHWAQADFVRKTSVVTYGYVDTLLPGKNELTGPPGWAANKAGYPNLFALGATLRASEFDVLLKPAPEDLPTGTSVSVEFRASETFDKQDTVWDQNATETATSRGNLLNPDFAAEQFRYATSARVSSGGMTNYTSDIDSLVDAKSGVAPRFVNWRFTLENNTAVTPALVPFVDSFAIVYRVVLPK